MNKRIIGIFLCILIITLQFVAVGSIAFAQNSIVISARPIGKVAEFNGVYYVSPVGTYAIQYRITNESNFVLKDIEIRETGPGQANPAIITGSPSLEPGKTSSPLTGNSYSGDPGGSNTVKYKVQYSIEGEDTSRETGEYSISVQVAQADFRVNYTSSAQGMVFKGEQVELTAEVESLSNVPLYNITVVDSDLNQEIGVIKELAPGARATVKTTASIEKSTNGNLTIYYDLPGELGLDLQKNVQTGLKLDVRDEEPVSSLELSGKTDKKSIPGPVDVEFELTAKNTGNTVLKDIKFLDWDGKEFHTRDAIQPGEEIQVTFTREVQPGTSYEILVQGRVDNSNQLIKSTWSTSFEKLTPQVDIQRTLSVDSIQPGEPFELNYVVRNTGNVDLLDVVIEESAFGEVHRMDSLPAGQEAEFSKELVLEQDTFSKTILKARDAETQKEYVYESAEMEFKLGIDESLPRQDLSILLRSETESLDRPGKVELECIVKNTGREPLYNLVFTLQDRDMVIDNISVLEPGEDKTILIPALQVDETETFMVEASGIGADGETFTAQSQPLTIEVGGGGLSGKFSVLRVILIIIILLCVLVIGVLVYILRDSLKLPAFIRKIGQKFSRKR